MRSHQFQRPNPQKPTVSQHLKGGMWWAQAYSLDGKFIANCFFTRAEALTRAYELAAMNKEAAK